MFVNERVGPDALEPGFEAWAHEFALSEVHRLIAEAASDWFTATDEFYLWNRMQRWAGARDTAVVADREVVNPMLDLHFLDLARGLTPHEKQNARYLSRIQMSLDPALGRVALDGRPAPDAFARRGPVGQARIATATAHKAVRKARQRLGGRTRPPAGGEVLAARVAQHWRETPSDLQPVRRAGVFREAWLDQVASGDVQPTPAEVALLVNLCCAASN
jgi:asparagine synthase (glutamine-hydrolysing)